MRLWLLRHGEAEPRAASDALRELTERGRNEARAGGEWLRGAGLERILVSPLVRAQQTAELVGEVLAYQGEWETVDWITPESDVREALRRLDAHEGRALLVVSHQPFLGDLGGWLVEGHGGQPLPMRTGSLAVLEGEAMAAGAMRLLALHHP